MSFYIGSTGTAHALWNVLLFFTIGPWAFRSCTGEKSTSGRLISCASAFRRASLIDRNEPRSAAPSHNHLASFRDCLLQSTDHEGKAIAVELLGCVGGFVVMRITMFRLLQKEGSSTMLASPVNSVFYSGKDAFWPTPEVQSTA